MILDVNAAREELNRALSSGRAEVSQSYRKPDSPCGARLEYCMFIKPELLENTSSLPIAVDIISSCLPQDVEVVGSAVLPGDYLRRHDLMALHYGTINRVSRLGVKAVSPDVVERIRAKYGAAPILGAHEFLAQHASYTAGSLGEIHDSRETEKVASGTYVIPMEADAEQFVILNGFHPGQLAMYYQPKAAILVLALRHAGDWAALRQEITGATEPAKAKPGSIREQLYARRDELGVDISRLQNGVHVSAGPVEGMSELARYFTDWDVPITVKATGTCFGRDLADAFGQAVAMRVADNPAVRYQGAETWIFDLTEEINPAAAMAMIGQLADQLAAA